MKSYEEFEENAQALMEKLDNKEKLSKWEKMFIAQYIYEENVPYDGMLLTYVNTTDESLDLLLKAYEICQDSENLAIVKSFSELLKKVNRQGDYHQILNSLKEEDIQLLEEWDLNFPIGNDDYTKSFEMLLKVN